MDHYQLNVYAAIPDSIYKDRLLRFSADIHVSRVDGVFVYNTIVDYRPYQEGKVPEGVAPVAYLKTLYDAWVDEIKQQKEA